MNKIINKVRDWLTEHDEVAFYLIHAVTSGLCWWIVSIEFAILFAVVEIHYDLVKGEKIEK